MVFTEEVVIAIQAASAAVHEDAHKLMLVEGVVASHRLIQLRGLQVQEKVEAWHRETRSEEIYLWVEKQHRAGGRVLIIEKPSSEVNY